MADERDKEIEAELAAEAEAKAKRERQMLLLAAERRDRRRELVNKIELANEHEVIAGYLALEKPESVSELIDQFATLDVNTYQLHEAIDEAYEAEIDGVGVDDDDDDD